MSRDYCNCECHRGENVHHFVACCYRPFANNTVQKELDNLIDKYDKLSATTKFDRIPLPLDAGRTADGKDS